MPDNALALSRATDDMQALLARTDTKASLLLALDGALLAVIATTAADGPSLPAAVRIVGAFGVLALAAAAALLLTAVRPCTDGPFTAARLLVEHGQADGQEQRLDRLAALATRKLSRIGWAVDCTLTGGVLLAAAAALAVFLR